METLVIDRGKWLTGTAHRLLSSSTLCDEDTGLMCCLGFYGEKCGLTPERMHGHGNLTSFELPNIAWLDEVDAEHKRIESQLIETNDQNKGIHPSRREARIAKLFKKYGGIDVTFVGRYADATSKARKAVKNAN